MKIKKIITLGCMIPLLASCGAKSIAGRYGFQMGREKGTHFGLFLDLYDDAYSGQAQVQDAKKMKLSFNASFPAGDSQETQEAIDSVLDLFKDPETGDFSLNGYYKTGNEVNEKGEPRLVIGLDFIYIFQSGLSVYKEITGQEISQEAQDALEILNNDGLIQSLLIATYAKEEVNAYIPVSMDDVYYQLYWYGYDIQIVSGEENFDIELVPVTKHDFGTTPTKEDVEEINKTFPAEHQGMQFTTYRAFNQLKLTLIK